MLMRVFSKHIHAFLWVEIFLNNTRVKLHLQKKKPPYTCGLGLRCSEYYSNHISCAPVASHASSSIINDRFLQGIPIRDTQNKK